MAKPSAKPSVLEIHPYVPGQSTLEGRDTVIKLASNESALGPSPKVREAVTATLERSHLYPDGGSNALRAAIGAAYGLNHAQIMCSGGSEQILSHLAQAFTGPGDSVVQSQYGFLAYRIATLAAGAELISAPEVDYTADVDAILAAVRDDTKLVFIANPNNPTGTMISAKDMARLRAGLRDDILLAIDAAYAEYVDDPEYSPGYELVNASVEAGTDNVIVSHTFSKIYGIAALRVGWCYGPPSIIDALNRIRPAFNVTVPGQVAAIAALADADHTAVAKAHNDTWLPKMTEALKGIGLSIPKSFGNFVLARFPGGEAQAMAADAHLKSCGIIVRPVAGYGLKDALRITIGTEAENSALITHLGAFMAAQ